MGFRASKNVIFIAKPLRFLGTSFDPSLLCRKAQRFLELQKRVIFIAQPFTFPGNMFDPSLLCNKTQWFQNFKRLWFSKQNHWVFRELVLTRVLWSKTQSYLELQKRMIFIAKPLSFPGSIFDPSLLCSKTQWLLELQENEISISKPWSFPGTSFDPSLLCNKT